MFLDQILHVAGEHPFEYCFVRRTGNLRGELRQRGWLGQEMRGEDSAGSPPELHPAEVAVAVRSRKPSDLIGRSFFVVPDPQGVVSTQWLQASGIERIHREPVTLEFQLVNNLVLQQMTDVRAGRDLEAGEKFFGDATPADRASGLEHKHLGSCPCKVTGGHQTVVAAAHDDDLGRGWHHEPPFLVMGVCVTAGEPVILRDYVITRITG